MVDVATDLTVYQWLSSAVSPAPSSSFVSWSQTVRVRLQRVGIWLVSYSVLKNGVEFSMLVL